MQAYTEIQGSESIKSSRIKLLNNDKTSISNSSGEFAPTNPLIGQTWYDTKTNKLCVWNGETWQKNIGALDENDKAKLDGIEEHANNYKHPVGAGYNHIPSGGIAGNVLCWTGNGSAAWTPPPSSGISRPVYFYTSGTYVVPDGVTAVYVSGCAGGGGGSFFYGGGGGESILRKKINVTPGESISIVIGGGGHSSVSSPRVAKTVEDASGNGGDTRFGNYITLHGGKGTSYTASGIANMPLAGGAGATHGGHTHNCIYGSASSTTRFSWEGGRGGDTLFGTGGTGGTYDMHRVYNGSRSYYINGSDGIGYGSGGGGAGGESNSYYITGAGDGACGIIIIEVS